VRRVAPLVLVAAALLAAPATGFGAVIVGSNLPAGATLTNLGNCTGVNCTYGQVAPLPAADTAAGGLSSPMDGVITKWRIRSGSSDNSVKLRILRPTGSGAFTAAGTSAVEKTVSGVALLNASLPIKSGDFLGVNNNSDALIFGQVNNASAYYWNPPLADGTNRSATGTAGSRELMVNATVEPDVDCDGKGDESQDQDTDDGPCKQGGGGGGGGGGGDTTAPVIDGLAAAPAKFKTKGKKRGTSFSYNLSEAAAVTFTIERRQGGRRVAGNCVRQTKKNRKRPACIRFTLGGALNQQGVSGKNSKRFTGKIGTKTLKPGRYRATLIGTDAAGNASAPARVSFRIVR
jgi:hypothetical protein